MNRGVDVPHTYTRRERKKRKTASSGSCRHIPDDLLINHILCRLPLPCLFRCTTVCKAWRSLVRDAHTLYGGTLMANFSFCFLFVDSCFSVITPPGCDHCNNKGDQSVPTTIISGQFHPHLFYFDVSNGFFLHWSSSKIKGRTRGYTMRIHVFNPLTSKSVPLPLMDRFSKPHFLFSMLAFDPRVSRHYKVLSFFGNFTIESGEKLYEKVCVFSSEQGHLGWRRLKVGLRAPPNVVSLPIQRGGRTVCLNGYAYRLGFKMGTEFELAFNFVVLSFHIEEERFELIDSPPSMDYVMNSVWRGLDKAEDCLQYIYNDAAKISIWRLQEDDHHRWALRHTICLNYGLNYSTCTTINPAGSCALDFRGNEEIVYFMGAFGLLYRYFIKRHEIECYRGSDGKLVRGQPNSLCPFLCCAIDPEFRRHVLRPDPELRRYVLKPPK